MRMNTKQIVIIAILASFVLVYTIHINWKQKKELAAYSHETEVYEKHIDELTAKLNECTERKQQWGIKFENENKRVADLQAALDASRLAARKSLSDSSDQVRQSNERLADLESQVKQLTDLRTGLEKENSDLRKLQQERLANDSNSLARLHKQLDSALAREKQLKTRIEALEALSTATKSKSLLLDNRSTESTVATTKTDINSELRGSNGTTKSAISAVNNSSLTGTKITSLLASNSSTLSASSAAPVQRAAEKSPTMVLRPPLLVNKRAAVETNVADKVDRRHQRVLDESAVGAAPAADEGGALI